MKTDILYGLPFADYESLKAVNRRTLSNMGVCPAYCRWMLDHPSTRESPALTFGRLVHTACLEPLLYNPVRKPKFGRTKAEQEAKAEFERLNAGRDVVDEDDYFTIEGIAEAFQGLKLFDARHPASKTEVTIVWSDKDTSLRCKARPDLIAKDSVFDLKTTRDISKFHKEIFHYGYHLQAAWYLDAAQAAGFPVKSFWFVAIQKESPHLTRMIEVDTSLIKIARARNADLLGKYAACELTGMWPGYPEFTEKLFAPAWMAEELALTEGVEDGTATGN